MENIQKINALLLEEKSIAKVEKLLGYGKDTLRKKLNRQGYKFNKLTMQYELVEPPEQDQKQVPKKDIVQVVTPSYKPKVYTHQTNFTGEQVEILHRMIKEYELKERISIVAEDKGELGNRNVRVYVEHFNKFSDLCKKMNVTQADMLYEAINLLVEKYK